MSGAVDDDVARTVASGRETLGDVLSTAQTHLQKVFIVFVVGLIGTIWVLRKYVWEQMRADLLAKAPGAKIIAVTPFDVILLQVKIGIIVGILLALPVLLYYSRDALRRRGWWPEEVARWKLVVVAAMSAGLFLGGASYGYRLFFPLAFDFLASNAVKTGIQPTYSIVKWAQFVFLLMLSFGLAAQLPLAMSALAYAGIVPYQVFRDYWKHAIVVLYALGALFTPPDPLTQIMWATPLVVLYAFSLALTRFVVTAKASSERVGAKTVARERWNMLAGAALVAGAAVFFVGRALANGAVDPSLARYGDLPYVGGYLPESLATDALFGLDVTLALALLAVGAGLLAAVAALVYFLFDALGELPREGVGLDADAAAAGDPSAIDLSELDAAGVRAAPAEAFVDMTEDEALERASEAMDAGDAEKAQAVLDRFDEVQAATAADPVEAGATAAAANRVDEDGTVAPPPEAEEAEGNVVTSTASGMVNAFTEDETTEEDIGGYYYDFAFVVQSLTSKAFRIVGVFMTVLAVVFGWLYTGGFGDLKADFLTRLPQTVRGEQVDVVALHPVEVLIFEIKVATIVALLATVPILLYYAWPALTERGFAGGNRDVLLVWGVALFAGAVAGSVVGYLYVAPTIISWLAADAIQANMVIAYRITNFGWLVVFTTVGVGLLMDVPATMFMFHRGGLVSFATMRERWREVTIAVFALVAFLSPKGVFMMFLLGVPVMLCYALGLGFLWLYTLGGRRRSPLRPSAE